MNRRTALKVGAGLGVVGATGFYGWYEFLPLGRSRKLEPVDELARRLYVSLDPEQRAETCVHYDHPLRQYHNRGVPGGGRMILGGFSREQRRILTDLLYAGLSTDGQDRVPEEFFTQWTGVQSMRALICGDPTSPPYQVILTGPHLNLRLGGKNREGVAFGGPQVYGDQRGNNRVGLPGNLYRDQFAIGQRLLHSLDEGRKKLALREEAPIQTQIELRGKSGAFLGIPIAELTADGKNLTRQLIERIFSTYPPDDVTYANECLTANGGIDKLFLSYYQHGEDGNIFEGQVFRLEGPGAVFYFRGFPHVHAFVNVAMDGDAPMSVGEPLGDNPAWLEHDGVKDLFERALLAETKSEFAFYNQDSVVGKLRPGPIHAGDIYNLESWQEKVEVVEIRGSNLSPEFQSVLQKRGDTLDSTKTYKIATTSYAVSELQAKLGRIVTRRSGPMLRDLTVAYLRSHGLKNT